MVLALAERVAMVVVDNFFQDISLGYGVYYGVATILPEVIVSAVMLAVLLFSFSQSNTSGISSSSLKTNSTYNSDAATEMSTKNNRYAEYS